MKLRIRIIGMVAVFFLGWLNRASAKSAADKIYNPTFPQLIEVIPGKLKVKAFLHEVEYEKDSILHGLTLPTDPCRRNKKSSRSTECQMGEP
jgi:hypothetical protein